MSNRYFDCYKLLKITTTNCHATAQRTTKKTNKKLSEPQSSQKIADLKWQPSNNMT